MVKFGFKSDRGKVRETNQDAYFVLPEEGIFLIADGVGGHTHGELASRTAMSDIAAFVRENPIPHGSDGNLIKQYMSGLARLVNEHIYAIAGGDTARSMATTLVALYIDNDTAYALNVGDSRVYLIRGGIMKQITEDHTFVNDLVKKGIISRSEAETHPDRNMITKALGADKTVEPDVYSFMLQEGDILLMCTDGLYNEVPADDIVSTVQKDEDMRTLCSDLVSMANDNGGGDNITVITIRI